MGLAFEIHDDAKEVEGARKEKEARDEKQELGAKVEDVGEVREVVKVRPPKVPSVLDQLHYTMNHVGLIAGPYYR